ncbi:ROK family transcriptional regulator [Arthrobacter zhaoguopingii]|uniref:ROK family transcriptional regulator n=1 Tax=Arthrobacter zhaoguopingii TaxID=2681491 RepID=UPI00135BA0B7|nr:ROK family transcriptional regulator [Arthrobacter zhaoguopingii]
MESVLAVSPDSPVRSIAREVLIHGPISRSNLASRLGLSGASLTRLSKPLLDAGVVRERNELVSGGVGRPTRPLEIVPEAHRFVGIKLSGTSAAGVATNLRSDALATAERPLPSHEVRDVVSTILAVIEDLGGASQFSGVGISIGGKLSTDGVVVRAPFLGWRDVPLAQLIEAEVAVPVAVENDVVALTMAEHWFGGGRGETDFAVLTVGAGVGYGLVLNDAVIAPPDAGLGLVGHYPLDPSGPLCFEGHRGCSSAVLTIPGICAQVTAATGRQCSYEEILEMARGNHPVARAVTDSAGTALGTLIAAVGNLTMVDLVVLSGEGMELADVAPEKIDAAIANHRDPEATPIRLKRQPTDFGEWARGAAAVVIQRSILGTLR